MAPASITLLERVVDLSQPTLYVAIAWIIFNPLFWNLVARREARHRTFSRLLGGSRMTGCVILAVIIFSIGILRDRAFEKALRYQPKMAALNYGELKILSALLFAYGSVLVASSMWKLGFTGTYLGDYWGILMDEKVESFPFNVTEHPMYNGSAMCFYASALWFESPVGILLASLMLVVYRVAMSYEGPYTEAIYKARDERRAQANHVL